MRQYDFTVYLDLPELTDEAAEKLFEAGCDDGSPASSEGYCWVTFHRDARSLGAAIRSAVSDVKKAGYEVAKVEIEREDLQNLLDAPAKQNT